MKRFATAPLLIATTLLLSPAVTATLPAALVAH